MFKKQDDEEPQNPEHLLTLREVMEVLHVSRSLVYLLVQRGELHAFHIGRALRFRAGDVQQYIGRKAEGPWMTIDPKRKVQKRKRRSAK